MFGTSTLSVFFYTKSLRAVGEPIFFSALTSTIEPCTRGVSEGSILFLDVAKFPIARTLLGSYGHSTVSFEFVRGRPSTWLRDNSGRRRVITLHNGFRSSGNVYTRLNHLFLRVVLHLFHRVISNVARRLISAQRSNRGGKYGGARVLERIFPLSTVDYDRGRDYSPSFQRFFAGD